VAEAVSWRRTDPRVRGARAKRRRILQTRWGLGRS
jgi:hypothetical protein